MKKNCPALADNNEYAYVTLRSLPSMRLLWLCMRAPWNKTVILLLGNAFQTQQMQRSHPTNQVRIFSLLRKIRGHSVQCSPHSNNTSFSGANVPDSLRRESSPNAKLRCICTFFKLVDCGEGRQRGIVLQRFPSMRYSTCKGVQFNKVAHSSDVNRFRTLVQSHGTNQCDGILLLSDRKKVTFVEYDLWGLHCENRTR